MKIRFQIIVIVVLAVASCVSSLFTHGRSKKTSSSSNSTSADNQQLHALLGTILTVKIGLLTALRDGLTRKQSGGSGSDSKSSGGLGGLGSLLGGGGSGGFNPLSLLGGALLGGSSSSASAKSDTSFDDFDEEVEDGDSVFTADES